MEREGIDNNNRGCTGGISGEPLQTKKIGGVLQGYLVHPHNITVEKPLKRDGVGKS